MSLPEPWVERIFDKLTITWGHQFLSRWDGMPLNKVKADWADELSAFQQHPRALWWALDNLPDRPPSAPEFKALARKAPQQAFDDPLQPRLPAPVAKADPQRVEAELARLRASIGHRQGDNREWARQIVARHRAGDHATPTVLRMAQEALALAGASPAAARDEDLPWQ